VSSKDTPFAYYRIVSTGYFNTMQMPLLSGRNFTEHDTIQTPGVAVINETMARRFWPNGNPLGSHVTIDDANDRREVEIVGVTSDVKHKALEANADFELFIPINQTPQDTVYWFTTNQFWVIRSKTEPSVLASDVRHVIQSSDNDVATETKTMDDYMAATVAPRRFNLLLLGIFAGTALVLTVVGIYGVMTTLVSQRSREIGIRIALGARRTQMGAMVVLHGLKLVSLGIAIGLVLAALFSRVWSNLLFRVSPEDPITYAALVSLILFVAMVACCIPALRAMRVDPMTVLREQ
jgi:predicted permease